jgi:hypothetical protein
MGYEAIAIGGGAHKMSFCGYRLLGSENGAKCSTDKDCRSGACDCKGPSCAERLAFGRCVAR